MVPTGRGRIPFLRKVFLNPFGSKEKKYVTKVVKDVDHGLIRARARELAIARNARELARARSMVHGLIRAKEM